MSGWHLSFRATRNQICGCRFQKYFAKLARIMDMSGSKKLEKRLCLDSFQNGRIFTSLPFTQFTFFPQGLDSPPHLPLASPPHAGVAKRINLVNCVRHGDKQLDGDMVNWSWIEMAKQDLYCKIIQPRWSVTSQWSTLTTGSASYRAPSTSCRWSCSPWSGTSAGPSLPAETLTNISLPQVCRAGHLFHRAVSGAGGPGCWRQHNGAGKELDL